MLLLYILIKCVTFPISSCFEENSNFLTSAAVRALWSYFIDSSGNLTSTFPHFFAWLNGLSFKSSQELPSLSEALDLIERHTRSQPHTQPDGNIAVPIVVIIDELLQFRPDDFFKSQLRSKRANAISFLSNLCELLDFDPRFHLLVTSIDQLTVNRFQTQSSRKVHWVRLRRLSPAAVNTVFSVPLLKQLNPLNLDKLATLRLEYLIEWCAVETSGHPRTLSFAADFFVDEVFASRDDESLKYFYKLLAYLQSNLPLDSMRASINACAFALLGEPVQSTLTLDWLQGSDAIDLADAVANSIYLYSAGGEKTLVPRMSCITLRAATESLSMLKEVLNDNQKLLGDLLATIHGTQLDITKYWVTGPIDGFIFYDFHCTFERCKFVARAICSQHYQSQYNWKFFNDRNVIRASLVQHYQLYSLNPEHEPPAFTNASDTMPVMWLCALPDGEFTTEIPALFKQPLLWSVAAKAMFASRDPYTRFSLLEAYFKFRTRNEVEPNLREIISAASPGVCSFSYNQPGFDAAIVVESESADSSHVEASSNSIQPASSSHSAIPAAAVPSAPVCILLQMKFSIPRADGEGEGNSDASNRASEFNLAQLNEALAAQKPSIELLRNSGAHVIIVVVVLWRPIAKALEGQFSPELQTKDLRSRSVKSSPDAVLLLSRQQLERFYVSLNPFPYIVLKEKSDRIQVT